MSFGNDSDEQTKNFVQMIGLLIGIFILLVISYHADRAYKKQIVKEAIKEMEKEKGGNRADD